MKNKILLPNRYGDKNYLEKIGGNEWKLIIDEKGSSCLRVIGEPLGEVNAIDPSGGPFMAVGDEITGVGIINRIIFDKEKKYWILTINEKQKNG